MKIKDKINPDQIKEAERLDFIFRSNQEFAKGFRAQIRRIEYDLAYFQKNEQQVNKLLDLKKEYEFFLENLHRENLLIAKNLAANPAAIYLPGMLGQIGRAHV